MLMQIVFQLELLIKYGVISLGYAVTDGGWKIIWKDNYIFVNEIVWFCEQNEAETWKLNNIILNCLKIMERHDSILLLGYKS